MFYFWLALFIALNALDGLLTMVLLRDGKREANPLYRFAVNAAGSITAGIIAAKVALMAPVIFIASWRVPVSLSWQWEPDKQFMHTDDLLWIGCLVIGAVCAWNLRALIRAQR